jgi:hypothetical protein
VVHVLIVATRRERVSLVEQEEHRFIPECIRPRLGLGERLDNKVAHLADVARTSDLRVDFQ